MGLSFPLQPFDLKTIKEGIKKFLETNPTEEEIVSEKISIRGDNPRLSEREISRLFEIAQKQIEIDESRSDREKETNDLLKLGEQSLKLSDYLPEALAEPINLWCQWMNIRPEVALTTVLATLSSLHKVAQILHLSG